MDALSALWMTSLAGALGFTATGYFLARSGILRVQGDAREAPQREAERREPEPVPEIAAAAEVVATPPADDETEKQLQALRRELRAEVLERDKVETYCKELTGRLSTMTEQVTALRARVSEEAHAARIARDSAQAAQAAQKRSSIIPSAGSDAARSRLSMRAPGLFAEIEELKGALAKCTAENESLRAAALGAPTAARKTPSARTDLVVPEVLKRMVDRIARLDNVRAAAVAESSGLVLAGSGELAEALAAFGAYLADAASRSDRLLPLRPPQEVIVRDANGLVFATRVLGNPQAELALVTLGVGEVSPRQLQEIVGQTPGLGEEVLRTK